MASRHKHELRISVAAQLGQTTKGKWSPLQIAGMWPQPPEPRYSLVHFDLPRSKTKPYNPSIGSRAEKEVIQ